MNELLTIPEDRSQFVQKQRTVIQKFLLLLYCGKMMVNLVSLILGILENFCCSVWLI